MGDLESHEAAVTLMDEWLEEGRQLVLSEHWAAAIASGENPVDKPIPPGAHLLRELQDGDVGARNTVAMPGSVASFLKYVFEHNGQIVSSVVHSLPFYHNRIGRDVEQQLGSIPLVCRGILSSVKANSVITENVDGHQWVPSPGSVLRWGGGGYALLDQAYVRNSALAYVGQLAVIVVKAILEN